MRAADARRIVRDAVASDGFLRFAGGTPAAGERAVAIMGAARRAEMGLGGGDRILRLSADTVGSHPRFRNFTTEDWLRVQQIVDDGASVAQGRRHRLLWMEEESRSWVMVMKETARDESYLVSYRRASRRQAERWRDEPGGP